MQVQWKSLTSVADIDRLVKRSDEVPCLIFKHSTRCSISSIAQFRLQDDWCFPPEALEPYFLDLIAHRDVSAAIADIFQVHHESPQVLLISGGTCIYDASHLDIQVSELKEVLDAMKH